MARFPTYTFSPEAARYRSLRTGRFASTAAIRNALFQAADAEMQRAKRISEQVRRGEMSVAEWRLQVAGFDEIATELHPAEHCEDCVREAARGFVPIGTEVPLGQRQCRHRDRCTARFRNSQTGEEVAA